MAKLTNVKTIDMVNGEITKIAYDGAEYAKVVGMAARGDILLRVSKGIATQVTVGNFYKCPKKSSEDKTWYTDEEGDNMTSASYNFAVFRKISDDKPALSTRVDALEERVDALETRKPALEGAEQADAKTAVGATIKVVKSNFGRVFGEIDGAGYGKDGQGLVKIGATGEIVDVNSKGIFAKFTEADMISGRYNRERFYLENGEYEVSAPKPQYKTEKRHAKVGERILITHAAPLYPQTYAEGDLLTVTKADVFSKGDVNVKEHSGLIDYLEYEVIVEDSAPADAKPAPAKTLTHNGATYTLVTRKAQPGDVVVIPKEGASPYFDVGGTYLVSNKGTSEKPEAFGSDGGSYLLYNYGRTEANTLVYTPVAQPLQVGDYVKPLPSADDEYIITGSRMKLGKVGAVESERIYVEIVTHEEDRNVGREFNVLAKHFRKATDEEVAEATQPAKPKAGDIVVITANTNGSRNKVGDIGKVGSERNGSLSVEVHVPGRTTGNGNYTRYNEMRLATPAEVAQYHKAVDLAALKAGDLITIDVLTYPTDLTAGKAYEVHGDCDGELYIRDDAGDKRYTPIKSGAFAVVDAKDAVFAKIGRKPNEFKKGDIVRVTIDNALGSRNKAGDIGVVEELIVNAFAVNVPGRKGTNGNRHMAASVELIAPVESRADLPSGTDAK